MARRDNVGTDGRVSSPLISADALRALIEQGVVAVFDCSFDLADPARGRALYRDAHVPGAHYLHLDDDLASPPSGANGRHPLPDAALLAATLRRLGLRAGQRVVAYDRSGGPYAARLWGLRRWMSHDRVAVLDGGLAAWRAAGGRVEQGDPPPPAMGDFVAGRLLDGRTVAADDLIANLDGGALRVLDARAPGRFRGDPNPLDPVAGRIPGARNRFYMDNLDETGRFKRADVLAAEFDAAMGDAPPHRIVLQCGSGVTACHNALAMAIADRPGARLYPGSWSEWIADPARPIERG